MFRTYLIHTWLKPGVNEKTLACGSVALVKGTVIETSGGGTAAFKAEEVSIWKSMFGVGTRNIRAYGCIHCQHLQLAVDLSEEDSQRYQQFEGEQPGVLERISSDPIKLEE